MEAARPKVNSDPGGKSMLLKRYSLFCTQLDSSIPCSAHSDPTALRPSHAQSLSSPSAVTTLSTTGAAASQAATFVSLILPCPAYFCSHISSPVTLSSASQGLCLPELSLGYPPLVTPLFGCTALACSRKAHRALTGTSPTTACQSS